MNGENQFSEARFPDRSLEQAVKEIREEPVDADVVEAAAARVWAKLQAQTQVGDAAPSAVPHAIRNCADFQALLPEYRAGQLTGARRMLLEDHLHQCVACRRIQEGRVTAMPAPRAASARTSHPVRWAAAAVVVAAAGLSVWVIVNRGGAPIGRAIVQSVNGTLFEVSAAGIQPLAAGTDLPYGVEIRTAPETDAVLQLGDGSLVEMRERSGISADTSSPDVTIHLTHGSVIVTAAKRRAGHLYVVTPQCNVSVTGTLFGVTAGTKGSRVSVLQGEVRVSQDNQEKVLHSGDQTVSGEGIEPEPVRDDISWSRNHDKYFALLAAFRGTLKDLSLANLRYSSKLLDRLPQATMFYASVPNLSDYLASAESALRARLAADPELAGMSDSPNLAVLDKLRAASAYLGDEVVMAAQPNGHHGLSWVFFAQLKNDGFADYVKHNMASVAMESRNGFAVFGLDRQAVEQFAPALDTASSSFVGTPFYQRIQQAYRDGAGLLFCADLSTTNTAARLGGARYLVAGQKEIDHRMEASATLVFDHERQGIPSWLAAPAPMGSLDYVTPDAALAAAFVTRNPGAIVDEVSGVLRQFGMKLEILSASEKDLAASLGGEFGLALDGPALPVPSWKLVVEMYHPEAFQAALQKVVDAYNAHALKTTGKPLLRTSTDTLDGQTYYMVAGADPNPLTEVHYTFSGSYFIAAPSVVLLKQALETRKNRNSLLRSARFLQLAPHDRYANFSAVLYQNVAPTLGPIANLLGGMLPGGRQAGLERLGNLKPSLIAAYGDPDRLTVATDQNLFGSSLTDMMTGNVAGMVGNVLPLQQFRHQFAGTPGR